MDVTYWLNNIEVSYPPNLPSSEQAASAAATALASAVEKALDDEDDYFRVGRRTTEDVDGDIATQHIVVARINAAKQKVTWLSVATWQFNGLRIGAVDAGDRIKEDDEVFGYSTGLDPDPYFFARNLLSPPLIRKHLLELLSQGERKTEAETLDDDVAQIERDEAQWARMAQDDGILVEDTESMRAVASQDPRKRFPHPWALPTALTDSWDTSFIGIKPGPTRARRRRAKQEWRPDFDSIGDGGEEISSVNAIAVFVNDFDDRDLRLKHYIEVDFEPDESFESAMEYFLEGNETEESDFQGLSSNGYLAKLEWSLELWVLPQKEGCSTMILWNDVPQLQAEAFCDWRAIRKDEGKLAISSYTASSCFANGGFFDLAAKLYVEVRIVEKKARVASPIESEAAVASG